MEQRGDIIHFIVGIERVFLDAHLLALAFHHVDRVVQDPFSQEVTQLGQQNMRPWKVPHGDRQGANVVVMTMGNGDGVELLLRDELVERQAVASLALGVSAGVHQQAVAVDVDKPGARPDGGVRVQADDSHGASLGRGHQVGNLE